MYTVCTLYTVHCILYTVYFTYLNVCTCERERDISRYEIGRSHGLCGRTLHLEKAEKKEKKGKIEKEKKKRE